MREGRDQTRSPPGLVVFLLFDPQTSTRGEDDAMYSHHCGEHPGSGSDPLPPRAQHPQLHSRRRRPVVGRLRAAAGVVVQRRTRAEPRPQNTDCVRRERHNTNMSVTSHRGSRRQMT